jgi:glycosyltransferase involved in cell wall biosynthesis
MPLKQNLVSVVIPAYNQPDYLKKAIQSIVEQDYRPIEVIVSDDCSPLSLEPVVKKFSVVQNDLFTIRYFRNPRNLGVMDNFRFAVEQVKGRYLVPSAHDNRFISRSFFTDAVKVMSNNGDCHLCFGNAIYENSDRVALHFPEFINFTDGWSLVEGNDFIRLYLKGGIGWTQAVVIDHPLALSLKAYDEPFIVNELISRQLGMAQDNVFSYIFLLSAVGSIGLCQNLACEIGVPAESYSRSNSYWMETRRRTKFFIFYNLYLADLRGKYAADVKQMALKSALQYVDSIIDARVGQYYHWRPQILFLMVVGIFKGAWRPLRFLFKRVVNLIRPNTFKKTRSN